MLLDTTATMNTHRLEEKTELQEQPKQTLASFSETEHFAVWRCHAGAAAVSMGMSSEEGRARDNKRKSDSSRHQISLPTQQWPNPLHTDQDHAVPQVAEE